MSARNSRGLLGLLLVCGAAGLLVACNDATDDPEVSPNLISVSSVSPTTLCVDGDGEPIDLDGDGTLDAGVQTNVNATFGIRSRVRGTASASAFNDVILTEYEVSFSLRDSTGARWPVPSFTQGINIEVPAGGAANVGVEVIPVSYNEAYFPAPPGAAPRGTATIRFRGHDASGEPARTSARVGIDTANACN